MLLQIKVHSSYAELFDSLIMYADIQYYDELPNYFSSMHPKFVAYIDKIKEIGYPEPCIFLDTNKEVLTEQKLLLKRIKEKDVIYIVPAVIGGGGKRGGLVALLALLAVLFVFPIGLAGAGGAGGTAAGLGSRFIGLFAEGGKFAGTLKVLGVNLGLGLLAAAFQPKKSDAEKSRQNDSFGSLNNTTTNGTPIPLVFGMPRVAGQLLSGYINTIEHGKTDTVNSMGVIYTDVVPNGEQIDEQLG